MKRHAAGIAGAIIIATMAICVPGVAAQDGTAALSGRIYVSIDGDDADPGTGESPVRTLQAAVDRADSGYEVVLLDGPYAGPGNVDVAWTDKSLAFVAGEHASGRPEIACGGADGFVFTGTATGDVDRISFTGLAITGAATAVRVTSPSSFSGVNAAVAVTDCRIRECTTGFALRAADLTMVGTNLYRCSDVGITAYGSNFDVSLDGCVLRENGLGLRCSDAWSGWLDLTDTHLLSNGRGVSYYHEFGFASFERCRIDSSTADHGIRVNVFQGYLSLADCSVSENTGAGLEFAVEPVGASLQARDCQFVHNGSDGLALSTGGTGADLERVAFVDNGGWGIGPYTYSPDAMDAFPAAAHRAVTMELEPYFRMRDCDIRLNDLGGARFAGNRQEFSVATTFIVTNEGPGLIVGGSDAGGACDLTSLTVALNDGPGVTSSSADWTATNTIIALNGGPAVELVDGSQVTLACCDLYDNAGGDWVGVIAPQVDLRGNFSADPCFCDMAGGSFLLCDTSLCLPGRHPWGCDELVGAGGPGCSGCACGGVVPVYLAHLSANRMGDEVEITWHVNGDGDGEEFILTGRASGRSWQVPYRARPAGGYRAVDRPPLEVDGAPLTYDLAMAAHPDQGLVLGSVEVASAPPVAKARLLPAHPNPFNPEVTLSFDLPGEQPVSLQIYDVGGRHVATLLDGETAHRGRNDAPWDGCDRNGRAVPAGVYFFRLESRDGTATGRMALVK